jgi:spoIIIJ-associated protein
MTMSDASTMSSGPTPEPAEAPGATVSTEGSATVAQPATEQDHAVSLPVDNSGDNVGRTVDKPVEQEGETDPSAEADSAPTSTSRLEEEGDIAADYVEELLDISDIDGDIDIEVRNGRTYVSVIAEDGDERLRDLVGQDGKGLESLQELVRLAVLSATGNRSRLVLDIAGHRTERASELEVVAQEAVDTVRETGEPVHLKPMGAYERKIVHDVIAAAGLVSESEGEGPRRHVVVSAGD